MDGIVPNHKRTERVKMLRILSEKKRRAFYTSQKEQTRTVLFENNTKDGYINGFTDNYVKVRVKYDPILVDSLIKVKLSDLDSNGTYLATENMLEPILA